MRRKPTIGSKKTTTDSKQSVSPTKFSLLNSGSDESSTSDQPLKPLPFPDLAASTTWRSPESPNQKPDVQTLRSDAGVPEEVSTKQSTHHRAKSTVTSKKPEKVSGGPPRSDRPLSRNSTVHSKRLEASKNTRSQHVANWAQLFPEVFTKALRQQHTSEMRQKKRPDGFSDNADVEGALKRAALTEICLLGYAKILAPGVEVGDRLFGILNEKLADRIGVIYHDYFRSFDEAVRTSSVDALKKDIELEIEKFVLNEAKIYIEFKIQNADIKDGIFRDSAALAIKNFSRLYEKFGIQMAERLEKSIVERSKKMDLKDKELNEFLVPKAKNEEWDAFVSKTLEDLEAQLLKFKFDDEFEGILLQMMNEVGQSISSRQLSDEDIARQVKLALLRDIVHLMVVPHVEREAMRTKSAAGRSFVAVLKSVFDGESKETLVQKNYPSSVATYVASVADDFASALLPA
ncbi:hypothetical protein [Variovorax sp. KK3]|uniref:hypothetical protein n=1 Tax=Variovorax sp. KK3 TaxID=1855728 RepID=UPI00117EBFF3|nr:hypothetical protein [Variovorax sp. KK3]